MPTAGIRRCPGLDVSAANARLANILLLLYSAIKKTFCDRPSPARRRGRRRSNAATPLLRGVRRKGGYLFGESFLRLVDMKRFFQVEGLRPHSFVPDGTSF